MDYQVPSAMPYAEFGNTHYGYGGHTIYYGTPDIYTDQAHVPKTPYSNFEATGTLYAAIPNVHESVDPQGGIYPTAPGGPSNQEGFAENAYEHAGRQSSGCTPCFQNSFPGWGNRQATQEGCYSAPPVTYYHQLGYEIENLQGTTIPPRQSSGNRGRNHQAYLQLLEEVKPASADQ